MSAMFSRKAFYWHKSGRKGVRKNSKNNFAQRHKIYCHELARRYKKQFSEVEAREERRRSVSGNLLARATWKSQEDNLRFSEMFFPIFQLAWLKRDVNGFLLLAPPVVARKNSPQEPGEASWRWTRHGMLLAVFSLLLVCELFLRSF